MSKEKSKEEAEDRRYTIASILSVIQLYLMLLRDKADPLIILGYTLFFIIMFVFYTIQRGQDEAAKNLEDRQRQFDKLPLQFYQNHFAYHINTEQLSFPFAKIYKIILFGSNTKTQSLNIYYDTDKVYTFYGDMEEWEYLLTKLGAYYKFTIQTNENKQVLYQTKIS